MKLEAEAITILPAIILFLLSSYFAFSTSYVIDPSVQKFLVRVAIGVFIGGLILAVCWVYYWGIHKKFQQSEELTYSYK